MARTGSAHASGREKRIGKRGRKQCKNIVNKTRIAEKLYLNGRLVLPHPCRFFMIYRLLPNEEWGTLNPHNPFIVFVSSPVFPSPSWFRDSVRNTPTFFSTDRAPGEGDSTTELVFFISFLLGILYPHLFGRFGRFVWVWASDVCSILRQIRSTRFISVTLSFFSLQFSELGNLKYLRPAWPQ